MKNGKTDWFKHDKYGLFIHWGLYSLAAGDWNGVHAPHSAEWLMRNLKVPLADYRRLAEKFDPHGFDARAYARNAKKWGMKYLVVTAKHHDGFALYDSKVSDYNVMHTPYGRDIVRELADACREEGIRFGVYYSQMQDWEDPDGDGNDWDFRPEKKDFRRYFYGKCLPQVKELLKNYGDLCLIWFDTPYEMPVELCRELADTVRELQPDCLINGRIGYGLGDYRQAADNAIPVLPTDFPFEAPMTMNATWGYSRSDVNFKTSREVLENLLNVVGKGGNVLLNVGPDGNGEVPPAETAPLDEVGAWLEKNGESIYGTVPAPLFPYILRWGSVTAGKTENALYLHVRNYPKETPWQILLTGLVTKVSSVCLLADGTPLPFRQTYESGRDEHRFYVYLPEKRPDAVDTVLKVVLEGPAVPQVFSK